MYEHKPFKKGFFSEYTVFGVFIAVAAFGLIFGGVLTMMGGEWGGGGTRIAVEFDEEPVAPPEPITAPSVEEYRVGAKAALAVFVSAVGNFENGKVGGTVTPTIIINAQNDLLNLRVPTGEREAHLNIVLLLDQWKRALQGSPKEVERIQAKTIQDLASYPWLK